MAAGELPGRRTGLRSFAALFALSLVLVAFASWLEGSGAWRHPLLGLATLDQDATLTLLGGAAQVVAGALAILVTVVAIVLELAATLCCFSSEARGMRDARRPLRWKCAMRSAKPPRRRPPLGSSGSRCRSVCTPARYTSFLSAPPIGSSSLPAPMPRWLLAWKPRRMPVRLR